MTSPPKPADDDMSRAAGWDALLNDLFGLNVRALRTMWAIFATPRRVYVAARDVDWSRQYTPSIRLVFTLIATMVFLRFLWGDESSALFEMARDGFAGSPGLEARFDVDQFTRDYLSVWLVSYPFAYFGIHAVLALIMNIWGQPTPAPVRLRIYFATLLPSLLLGVLSTAVTIFMDVGTLTAIALPSLALSTLLYAVTVFRGLPLAMALRPRIWRSSLFAVVAISADLGNCYRDVRGRLFMALRDRRGLAAVAGDHGGLLFVRHHDVQACELCCCRLVAAAFSLLEPVPCGHEVHVARMATGMGNAKVESATVVAEVNAPGPPAKRGVEILRAARPGHHHGAEMGDSIDLAVFGCKQEQGAGPRLVLLTAQPAYEHEAEIETRNRQAGLGGLVIISSRGGQVLMNPPAMVKHGAERIGGGGMAVIRGLAHGLDRFQEQFPALTAVKQSLSAFKIEVPLIHAGTLDQTSRLASRKTQFCHNKSIKARFSGAGMTGAPWTLVCAPEPAESRIA